MRYFKILSAEFFTEKSEIDQSQTMRVGGILSQKLGYDSYLSYTYN